MATEDKVIREVGRLIGETINGFDSVGSVIPAIGRALETYTVDRPPESGSQHSVETIYANDFYAFCKLATAEALGELANRAIPSVDTMPQADFSALRSKTDLYRSRAKDLRGEYNTHIAKDRTSRVGTARVGRRGPTDTELYVLLGPDAPRRRVC